MASLNQVETQLLEDLYGKKPIVTIEKLSLYAEILLMIVQFVVQKGIFVGGKIKISWWNLSLFISIIGLFKEIVAKLTEEKEE